MSKPGVETEPVNVPVEVSPRDLDVYPNIWNLKEYHAALERVVNFLDSERYQSYQGLSENDYMIIGWLAVQERQLGMSRDRVEGKLRKAWEAATDPNRNRLFQMHGRHWSDFILEGESREEGILSQRQFPHR